MPAPVSVRHPAPPHQPNQLGLTLHRPSRDRLPLPQDRPLPPRGQPSNRLTGLILHRRNLHQRNRDQPKRPGLHKGPKRDQPKRPDRLKRLGLILHQRNLHQRNRDRLKRPGQPSNRLTGPKRDRLKQPGLPSVRQAGPKRDQPPPSHRPHWLSLVLHRRSLHRPGLHKGPKRDQPKRRDQPSNRQAGPALAPILRLLHHIVRRVLVPIRTRHRQRSLTITITIHAAE